MKNKTAVLGLFAALAILLGYVESLIPFFAGVYGVKIGLSNLMIVFLLYLYGWRGGDPDFCHTDSGDRFSVWQSVQYSVQSCGRIFKPACDGTAQKSSGIYSDRRECRRRWRIIPRRSRWRYVWSVRLN